MVTPYDAWGGSWGTSWGLSWTVSAEPQPDTPRGDGGFLTKAELAALRNRRQLEEAREAKRQKRLLQNKQELREELELIYDKAMGLLPMSDAAIEISEVIAPYSEQPKQAGASVSPPRINYTALIRNLEDVKRLLALSKTMLDEELAAAMLLLV